MSNYSESLDLAGLVNSDVRNAVIFSTEVLKHYDSELLPQYGLLGSICPTKESLSTANTVCKVAEEFREWVYGSFNACILVYIDDSVKFHTKKVFIRFPLPYKVGELQHPGNAEEKLRCEVATYMWIQSNCPDVPIPCLRGFGFPGGRSVCELY